MKNLIITLSFFLLLPLTGHANGLMKFKKVKVGEKPAKTEQRSSRVEPKLSYEYVLGVHTAIVNFMIKLESDIEKKKVSRSEAEKVLRVLREQLLIAEAHAQTIKAGDVCYYAGRPSRMSSPSSCRRPEGAQGSCPAGRTECDPQTFGSGICVQMGHRGAGLTRGCSIALDADPDKKRAVIESLQQDPVALQRISDERRAFCTNYQATNRRPYDGCAELLANTPGPAQPVVQQPVVQQPVVQQPVVQQPVVEQPVVQQTVVQQPVVQQPVVQQTARGEPVTFGGGRITAGGNCSGSLASSFTSVANQFLNETTEIQTRQQCTSVKESVTSMATSVQTATGNRYSNAQKALADSTLAQLNRYDCNQICTDPEEEARRAAAKEESDRQNEAARIPGQPKARRMGSAQGTKNEYGCFNKAEMQGVSCLNTLQKSTSENEDIGLVGTGAQKNPFFKPIERDVDLENPHSFVRYFMGQQDGFASALTGYEAYITPNKFCRLLASGCKTPTTPEGIVSYNLCVINAETNFTRPLTVGVEKTIAIVAAARETTKFESDDNYGGNPFECKGNKGDNGGLGFDHPKCKSFYNWYVALEATSTGFKVGNEAAVTTENMRNQTRLQQQIEEGNGQDAGFEASRNASIASQKAEERNMGFFAAKGGAILMQLNNWPKRENVCDRGCCDLFTAEGADRIDRDFFPNADAKNHIYAQAIAAATEVMVAKFKADLHKENARKVQAIKEQMQFTDDSEEGVMKFCVQFPQDVRCLSPGQRRALGASGTQFGSFQGSNFGLGSLEGEQGNEVSAGQDFGGSLAAGGPSGNVGNIGSADKDAAAAKNIFNAPAAARGGGGGGAGGGAGGGGGGGGSAQSGQLSRDEGLKEDKKESPIEITSKKAAYEGSKGGYNGGGYNPSNKKPGESPTANPFAGMFGKDQGRDPANVAEIDKPASDLFSKISRRYGEVQKRKALMEVADEGNGIR